MAAIQLPYHSYLPSALNRGFHPFEDSLAGSRATSLVSHEPQDRFRTDYDEPRHSSCQKLLFSATLTSDPGKIASLGLRDPKYFIVRETTTDAMSSHHVVPENFSMPANLTVGFHFVPTLKEFYKVVREGTHDRVRFFPETLNTLLSCTLPSSG